MLKNILVPIDATESSAAALALALDLAQRHKASLTGVAIIDAPSLTAPEAVPAGAGYYKHHKDETLLKQAHEQAQALIKQFAARCRKLAVAHNAMEIEGDPYAQILKIVDVHDLIAVGRDTNFYSRSGELLGAAVELLVKNNPRPVIVSPANAPGGRAALVAYDGSIPAMRALQMFALLRVASDNGVTVVSVKERNNEGASTPERAREFLASHGIHAQIESLSTPAHPAEIILTQAQSMQAGLLIMGAYGHRGWREWIMGSTTRTLLERSTMPLFIYH